MHRLGILLSGRGSNFLAIAEGVARGALPESARSVIPGRDHAAIPDAHIAIVISNIAEAPGIAAAQERNLHTRVIESRGRGREEHDRELIATLRGHEVDLVCLAGYMRLLSAEFVQAFPQRILNIHPSLLPAFAGLHAQRQALDYGAKVAGCTVHFVDEELDHGPIILQHTVPVFDSDDEKTLSARILDEEHRAYPEAIARVLSGHYGIVRRRYLRTEMDAPEATRPDLKHSSDVT